MLTWMLRAASRWADRVQVMAYDYHGFWNDYTDSLAPLLPSRREPQTTRQWNVVCFLPSRTRSPLRRPHGRPLEDYAIRFWKEAGVRAEKLLLGIATYGRGWVLEDPLVHVCLLTASDS